MCICRTARPCFFSARAARIVKEQHPRVGVLVLSQHIETTHAVNLVAHSGFGYLLKDRVLEVDEFLATAERVAAGGAALHTLNVPGRQRRSGRAQKARPKFPHTTATKTTVTGKPQVTVFAPGSS